MFGPFYTFPHVLISIPRVGGCKYSSRKEKSLWEKKSFLEGCQFSRTKVSNGDAQREKDGRRKINNNYHVPAVCYGSGTELGASVILSHLTQQGKHYSPRSGE